MLSVRHAFSFSRQVQLDMQSSMKPCQQSIPCHPDYVPDSTICSCRNPARRTVRAIVPAPTRTSVKCICLPVTLNRGLCSRVKIETNSDNDGARVTYRNVFKTCVIDTQACEECPLHVAGCCGKVQHRSCAGLQASRTALTLHPIYCSPGRIFGLECSLRSGRTPEGRRSPPHRTWTC